MAGITVPLIQ